MKTNYLFRTLICAMLALIAGNAQAQDNLGGVTLTLNGFTTSETDGVVTYSNSRNSSSTGHCDSFIYLNGEISNYNTIEFDVKWIESSASNSKLALQMIDNAGGTLCFEVCTNWNTGSSPVAILRYPGVVGGNIARVELGEAGAEDTWMHVKAVASSSEIAFYVNDTKIYSGANTYGRELWLPENNTYLYTYNTKSSYKNISFSNTDASITPDESEWIVNGGVTTTGDEESPIYTVDSSFASIAYNGDYENINSIECTVNYTGSTASNMEFVGLKVNSGTNFYQFAIWPNTASAGSNPVVLMQKNDTDPINRFYRLELTGAEFKKGNDIKMKVVAENGYFAFYLNDEVVASSIMLDYNFDEFTMTGASVTVAGCPTVVKDVAVSHQERDLTGYIDLEFADANAVKVMGVENGTLDWSNGALVATLGEGTVISSPEINVVKGHRYSAKLCVRNTMLLRVKNSSAAESLTVSFITKNDRTYDGEKQITLPIVPNSDYTTYMVNLSEVYDCGHWKTKAETESCQDYLAGFKLAVNGANEGTLCIDEISFQREDPYIDYAATSPITCVADRMAEIVTVIGTVKEQFAGKTITLRTIPMENYNQLVSFSGNETVAQATIDADGSFFIQFPLNRNNTEMTHLSSWFVGAVDTEEYPLSPAFQISNYRDFYTNNYEFELPSLTVDVTDAPYGAYGDAFTNDNSAIQSAIDYVSQQGGGKVVVPGSESKFGRRYIVTGLILKDNVELCIEKGAILWQSQRRSDYTDYELYFGHDNMGKNIAWGLSALMHYPLIFIKDATNVRVTGGGELRMNDIGSENLDGNGYSWDSNITVGCENNVHMVPVGIYGSTNVEVSDITVKRCNNWHMYIRESSRMYIANVNLTQVNCINGDGFDFSTAVNDVQLIRSSLYSNDDAVVIGVTTNDPRDDQSIWRKKITDESKDRSMYNFEIKGCNLFGGHGITFIPWASDFKDESKVEIRDISVMDCVLGGTSTAVGVWADNPFYGKSNYFLGTYGSTDATEDGDYSPMKDIVIINNKYVTGCSLYGTKPTNFITDCRLHSASTIQNGNFDKGVHRGDGFADETDWLTGLAYWSSSVEDNGSVGVECVGVKQAQTVNTGESFEQSDYAGFVKGNGELFEGLYLPVGKYELKMSVKSEGGESYIFVKKRGSDSYIINEAIENGNELSQHTFEFQLSETGNYYVGIMHKGTSEEKVIIDDCSIEELIDSSKYAVEGEVVVYEFSEPTDCYEVFAPKANGTSISNGQLVVASDAEYKIMFPSTTPLNEFMASMDIDVSEGLNINTGIYVLANNVTNSADKIDALNVQIESTKTGFTPKIFKFSSTSGYLGNIATGPKFVSESGIINLKVVVKGECLYVFIDNQETPCIAYELTESLSGDVGIRSQYSSSKIDRFTIQSTQYSPKTSGIDDIMLDKVEGDTVVYDLSGRRVSNPAQRGIYIVNGKKVLLQ